MHALTRPLRTRSRPSSSVSPCGASLSPPCDRTDIESSSAMSLANATDAGPPSALTSATLICPCPPSPLPPKIHPKNSRHRHREDEREKHRRKVARQEGAGPSLRSPKLVQQPPISPAASFPSRTGTPTRGRADQSAAPRPRHQTSGAKPRQAGRSSRCAPRPPSAPPSQRSCPRMRPAALQDSPAQESCRGP